MAMGRLAAEIKPQRGVDKLRNDLSTISQEGLSQASNESYYDPDDTEPVSMELKGRGVGEVRNVTVASTLWDKNVPKNLLRIYTAWDRKFARGIPTVEYLAVQTILDGIREAGPLKRCHDEHGTRVIPKSSQKCSVIFACVGINKADGRKPTRFKLPQKERVVCLLPGTRAKAFLAKLVIADYFWSIRMLPRRRRVFRVRTHGGCYRWLTLPFGWRYSPVVCHGLFLHL